MMKYYSTRALADEEGVYAARAILTGLAPDGGLYVPREIPKFDFKGLQGLDYTQVAFEVLRSFLEDYSEIFLAEAIDQSYGCQFDGKVGHLEQLENGLHALELWHGPTAAFKDYALQLMPRLLQRARRMLGERSETVILVATSGDTGSAALAGYADVPGVRIAAFYPQGGTSVLQRLQMTTQTAGNVAAYGVHGNFDDAQRGVKAAFVSEELARKLAEKGRTLSSANSINWGRLVPQIVYYATSYISLCARGALAWGQPLDFCVPTGNFGDIMAGWYAKQMGLPIGRLICASNKNNVLAEFLQTGQYNAERAFYKTSSPSMDILVSSNLERLLWHSCAKVRGPQAAGQQVRQWMASLAESGSYQVDADTLAAIRADFVGDWVDEAQVFDEVRQVYDRCAYLCDPHTAVAFRVLANLRAQGAQNGPAVVLSTASPFKFGRQVLQALGQPVPEDEFEAMKALQKYSRIKPPKSLAALQGKKERFTQVIDPAQIAEIPLQL